MYLMYVDESGSTTDPSQKYFILSGVSVFERNTHWIEKEMNDIAKRFCKYADNNDEYSYELHGSPMRSGKSEWRGIPMDERIEAMKDCLKLVSKYKLHIFAAVIEQGYSSGKDTITECFEQIASRFDMYLARLHSQGNTQRGIALFDKSSTEKSIQALARTFKNDGHTYGKLRNFAEVPLFLDSKSSRLIQLADLVSYAIFRYYEHNDDSFYALIKNNFDSNNERIHGIYLRTKDD